jgi:hypothetical protein
VVASQDISVIVETRSGTAPLKTAAMLACQRLPLPPIFPPWGRAPANGRNCCANTEGLAANVTIRFYNRSGNEMPNARQNLILNPHARSLTNLATLRDQGQLPWISWAPPTLPPITDFAEATTHFDAAPIVDTRHWRK